MNTRVKSFCCHNFIMTLLTSWISAPTALLLLHLWRAKVHASENAEEEIDYTYVIIGVTLGAVLAISFVAVIICMIRAKVIDSVFGESESKMDRRSNSGSSQKR
ncbi:transmembrane protein 273 [Chamaea fasciata]|uniref:transmembrane protein 273 n=1 Tax=Chamaea fasciata TaxID=190680 RepID=UPI00336AA8F4